ASAQLRSAGYGARGGGVGACIHLHTPVAGIQFPCVLTILTTDAFMLPRTVLLLAASFALLTTARAAEPLDPKRGAAIGTASEAFLTPHQEPGEEKDTPRLTPDAFRSTAPSLLRADRKGRGHGRVSFTKDLSRAFVEVVFDNVTASDVAMFHIHC